MQKPADNHYDEHLHKGATPLIYRRAQQLRQTQTEAEKILWSLLRNRKLVNKKFRRQHAFANYILDFYCHECKLTIELDGNYHNQPDAKEIDEIREKFLKDHGIRVVRFWNQEVIDEPQKVLQKIIAYLES